MTIREQVKLEKGIPKLRFGGFVGGWEEKKLGEVSDVRDGTHDSPHYYKEGFPLIPFPTNHLTSFSFFAKITM